MRIERITLKNFRSHKDSEIAGLGKFVVFMGANGAGKSSILDAVKYALTGTCRGTDDAGRGAEKLATGGDGEFELSMVTSKGVVTRRTGQGPRSQAHTKIGKLTGLDQEMSQVLLQPTQFMKMAPADQKALLMSLMAETITGKDVAEALGDLVTMPSGSKVAVDALTTLDGVNEMDRQLREKRPLLKGELSGLVYTPPEKMPGLPAEETTEIALEAARSELRDLENELIDKKAAGQGNGRELLQKRLVDLDAKAADISKRLDDLGERTKVVASIKEHEAKLKTAQEADSDRGAKIAKIEGEIAIARSNMATIKEQAAKLGALKGACPTCEQPVGAEYSKQAIESLRAKYEKLAKGVKEHQEQVNALRQVEAGNGVEALRQNLTALRQTLTEIDGLNERMQEISVDAEKVQAEMAKPQAKAASAEEIATLETRIGNGRSYVASVEYVIAEEKRKADVERKRQTVQSQLQWVEAMIEKLGPKGPIRAKLLGGGLGDLLAQINVIGCGLDMGKIGIQIEPWLITVDGLPAVMLSESELYRLSLAFAGVFAKKSGAGILCLDGADILDPDNRALLAEVLEAVRLDQVIVASTGVPPFPCSEGDWSFFGVGKTEGRSVVTEIAAPQGVE